MTHTAQGIFGYILMLILMLLNFDTNYAETDIDFCIQIIPLRCQAVLLYAQHYIIIPRFKHYCIIERLVEETSQGLERL